jgi:hypothetical protein
VAASPLRPKSRTNQGAQGKEQPTTASTGIGKSDLEADLEVEAA